MPNKALFLDRDGVINEDFGYVWARENFFFKKGIFEVLEAARDLGYKIIVVTNQSGIGRGMYSENDVKTLTRWFLSVLAKRGIAIAAVYYCPHAPSENCECRKPKSGMFEDAIKAFCLDPAKSVMIGDKESDIEAALGAGVGKTILLKSKYYPSPNTKANCRIKKLREAVKLL
ncbi:MAG: HAD family hydrolase [Helicobacteraceae bacterium]|jgi:D-glycero-D-manno-heptose 1,7-bisphosphate phosphatase|nr:HAD family hydrolase [Helicobacteraceae bacterium]